MFFPRRPLFPLALAAVLIAPFLPAADIAPSAGGVAGLKGNPRVPEPSLRPASDEPVKAMKRFGVAPEFKIELFAAEPLLGNPVAFTIDNTGRFFVSETYRYRTSVLDIRHYLFMLEDDLACRTVADREALIRKYFPQEWEKLGIETEVIRLLEDRDHDGRADFSAVYADKFNTTMDGIASGVLAHDDKVWFTNIPNVWQLSGTDAAGHAEKREVLSTGYGVRFSFTGHDLHGLILGPDGRLYFSFGDRAANVKTKEGKTLAFPDEGAVFCCEPDGSRLEMFCHGLRNPQELAFDKFGNLFTGDNDSDQGDQERWEYLVEGGDYGWRIGWQHPPLGKEHNPWLAEKMWTPAFPGQAAHLLPPVANIPDGPSGLAYYPGIGLPPRYQDHFFLCGFKGSSARSAISSWSLLPRGASFALIDQHVFVGDCQATDVTFGPDSKMYFSEWGEGWEGTGRGRIFSLYQPTTILDPKVAEVQQLLGGGLKAKAASQLRVLLRHADQRIRLEAQWALAELPDGEQLFRDTALAGTGGEVQLARLHAIWGLGNIARRREFQTPGEGAKVLEPLLPLLEDQDAEVIAQTARVLGENRVAQSFDGLLKALRSMDERISFFAAMGLAKLGRAEALPQIVFMLREIGDRDPFLRHAYVSALVGLADGPALQELAKHAAAPVRLAALLAMRRLERPEIATFLQDEDPALVLEAARAINDAVIPAAVPQLAALLAQPVASDPLMFRVLNANFRTGTAETARALAEFAARPESPDGQRLEALKLLALWPKPPARDRVAGLFRPLPPRAAEPAAAALHTALPQLLASKSVPAKVAALEAVAALQMKSEGPALRGVLARPEAPASVRRLALETLAAFDDPALAEAIQMVIADQDPALRVAASSMLAKLDPEKAAGQLAAAFAASGLAEKKAVLTALGGIKAAAADQAIETLLGDLNAGKIPAEVQLELLEAAALHPSNAVQLQLAALQKNRRPDDSLAAFTPALLGGDKIAGERIFKEHAVAQCFRCHKVGGSGGEAGPDLTGIGTKKDRRYLLESIVQPAAQIAEGFQSVLVTLKNGDMQIGVVKSETAQEVTLQMPAPGVPPVTVKKADIATRENAPSGMPPGFGEMLTRRELRDLVEYLASLKAT